MPQPPGNPTEVSRLFRTDDLPFAAFLHATRKLRFVRCQPNGDGRVVFLFDDPRGEGNQLQLQFESGAQCEAVVFYDSIRHLRRIMDRTRSNDHVRYAP